MASNSLHPGALVSLSELHPSSQYFKQGASLRVTGNIMSRQQLQQFWVEFQHLKSEHKTLATLNLRNGSICQFIGELVVEPDNESILNARVGRNVDGIDLNLYHQSIKLLRQFKAEHQKKNEAA